MKKTLLIPTILTLMSTTVATAGEQVSGEVRHHYRTIYDTVEVVDRQCEMVDVPVYGTRQVDRNGGAGGNALLGMILGGAIGKGITGDDKGAAAGAIMGGVIGADKGSKPKSEQYVKGYRREQSCTDVVTYVNKPKKVYDFSTLRFTSEGKWYKVEFIK